VQRVSRWGDGHDGDLKDPHIAAMKERPNDPQAHVTSHREEVTYNTPCGSQRVSVDGREPLDGETWGLYLAQGGAVCTDHAHAGNTQTRHIPTSPPLPGNCSMTDKPHSTHRFHSFLLVLLVCLVVAMIFSAQWTMIAFLYTFVMGSDYSIRSATLSLEMATDC
jgi:hypothetical protein